MKSPIPRYLNLILDAVRETDGGEVADYIPALAKVDPARLGVAICTTTGRCYQVGDNAPFSLQSISKPFTYALALEESGFEAVSEIVGVEPSGDAFNELSLEADGRPMNPMINAGAIAVNQLINGSGSSVSDRIEKILGFFSALAGRPLTINKEIATSELDTADRNFALAHMLHSFGIVDDDPHDAVVTYVHQCAIEVTVSDLAVMAATLASGGIQPVTGARVIGPEAARIAQSVMTSAGMYDYAGRWMTKVGIPAKSGVSGGLMGTLPGRMGIATFSPKLDPTGTSVRGREAFAYMSRHMDLHLLQGNNYRVPGVRSIHEESDKTVITLQGYVNFTVAEEISSTLLREAPASSRVILDVSRVTGFNAIGRKIVKEQLRRIREEGAQVVLYDPENRITDMDYSDGTRMDEVDTL
ncbi:glutaminase [Corynebacterium glucuronolyticum]|uniref:Glutaminase n=1 Tax=Corynebacterium glucuronolyticum TaxID=39791 RepID=A0A7T4EHM6_9CORY|nr:glutaminase [Corynebacterium glucuronolyticum]QQB47531.1 glutaminase [Corynebacterium glucuronolyticum]WKD64115.1 Glutaminase 2 [Corynebacterium glucuronolyticum DSM 44120]SMB84912.1 L-glutaminase [Corynebacterium glucuronolyticum]